MPELVRFENVTKVFGREHALRSLSLAIESSRIVGLVGTNGSGKSTLLRHIVGIYLPTSGECFTFGTPAKDLGAKELSRIGMVHQRDDFLSWMTVQQLLSYVGSFYPRWDKEMQERLAATFELDPRAQVESLSPGKKQRLAILVASCHHPELLILDEPLSNLDPLAREKILMMLLEVFRDDAPTIIISSHLLHDIERIVDHVICLNEGRLLLDEPLDRLQERFAEWTIDARNGRLPDRFPENWILSQAGDDRRRVITVSQATRERDQFSAKYGVNIESRPLNLEKIFTQMMGAPHARAEETFITARKR